MTTQTERETYYTDQVVRLQRIDWTPFRAETKRGQAGEYWATVLWKDGDYEKSARAFDAQAIQEITPFASGDTVRLRLKHEPVPDGNGFYHNVVSCTATDEAPSGPPPRPTQQRSSGGGGSVRANAGAEGMAWGNAKTAAAHMLGWFMPEDVVSVEDRFQAWLKLASDIYHAEPL